MVEERDARERRARRPARKGRRAASLYTDLCTAEEIASLADAAARDALDDELDLLRVMIRRVAAADGGNLEAVSRAIERLARTMQIQRKLRGDALKGLELALAQVVDELATELEGNGHGSEAEECGGG